MKKNVRRNRMAGQGAGILKASVAAGLCALFMAACAAPAPAPTVAQAPPAPAPEQSIDDGPAITDDIRIAAILPLSGPQSRLGEAMAQAIQMAFFEAQDPRLKLQFFDSLGSDADEETRVALLDEVMQFAPQAVVGPLFSETAQAIARPMLAQNVPVLSFSNDIAANAAGAILLGQQPEQEVARVLSYVAGAAETRRLGMIVPDDVYGARVQAAMRATVDALNESVLEEREALIADRKAAWGLSAPGQALEQSTQALPTVPTAPDYVPDYAPDYSVQPAPALGLAPDGISDLDWEADVEPWTQVSLWPFPKAEAIEPLVFFEVRAQERYPRDLRSLDGPARRVTQFDARVAEVEAERAYLTQLGDPMGLDYLDAIRNQDTFRQPNYDILLVGEGGQLLRALAPLLTVYAIDEEEVQLIGTGLWNDPALTREPALHGGLFAAAPADATARFSARYMAQYTQRPPALAASAYDAMAALSLCVRDDAGGAAVFDPSRLFAPTGFNGASGLFRILPSGITERTLAIMQITASGLETLEDAPDAFPPVMPEPGQIQGPQADPLS